MYPNHAGFQFNFVSWGECELTGSQFTNTLEKEARTICSLYSVRETCYIVNQWLKNLIVLLQLAGVQEDGLAIQ